MKKCEMFCYQCQETARGTGCTKVGVCGKRPELSSMLDLLIYVTKGLSCVTTKLREEGKEIGKDVNDSYSLALIALKLKEVFGLDDVNDLPIAFNIAWYEQKAVIVLLALLYLGVKNIHLGPTLPAFLSPNVAKVLVENFGIAGIGTVDEDLKLLVGETA